MTAVGTVRIIWRGGEHSFCLAKAGDIFALEDACKAGVAEIMHRLTNDLWRLNDVRETIRLALIGGGMEPDRAMTAVKLHVDGNPHGLAPSVVIAYSVLSAVLVGVPDNPLGKDDAAEARDGPDIFHDDGRFRRSAIYAIGAGLGWTPRQTDEVTVWELAACVEGYNRIHGGDDANAEPAPLSNNEFDELIERHRRFVTLH